MDTTVKGYSKKQVEELGFPRNEYQFPEYTGTFKGLLVMKEWGKRNLICYFDTENHERYKLCVWFDYNDSKSYKPRKSDIDFTTAELNTVWMVAFAISKSGTTAWMTAEPLDIADLSPVMPRGDEMSSSDCDIILDL